MDASALLLLKQLRELNRHPVEGISAGLIDESNPYAWNVILVGPADTFYEGGFFKARLDFPKEYPIKPPKMVEIYFLLCLLNHFLYSSRNLFRRFGIRILKKMAMYAYLL